MKSHSIQIIPLPSAFFPLKYSWFTDCTSCNGKDHDLNIRCEESRVIFFHENLWDELLILAQNKGQLTSIEHRQWGCKELDMTAIEHTHKIGILI